MRIVTGVAPEDCTFVLLTLNPFITAFVSCVIVDMSNFPSSFLTNFVNARFVKKSLIP